MIVHLFDDEKFVDITINQFENFSLQKNRYIVISDSEKLNYPKNINKILVLKKNNILNNINLIYSKCDLLIIHSMTPLKFYIVKHKPYNVKVLWSIWGADAYPFFKKYEQFEPETKKIRKYNLKSNVINWWIYDLYHLLKHGVRPINKEKLILEKIDYLATVLPPEFNIFKNEFNLIAKYVKFNYDGFTDIIKKYDEKSELGNNILVGNSASYTNNHLDIFSKIDLINSNLIVPLNYGDLKYGKRISKIGKKKYGDKFIPITNFLPINEYKKVLTSCNSMIMYQIRQQGLGNILLGIYLGLSIFLNKKSLTYKYLSEIGLIIFNLEDNISYLGKGLDENIKIKNKELILKYFGEKAIIESNKNIDDLVQKLN